MKPQRIETTPADAEPEAPDRPTPAIVPEETEPARPSSPPSMGATAPQASRPARRRGRKAFMLLGAVVLAILLGIGGYAWAIRNQESTEDAQVDAGVVNVAPRVGGTIAEVKVQDDTHVHAGDVIAVLDTADLDARLAQARAELSSAQAQLHAARAQQQVVQATASGGLTSAQAAVSGARVAVSSASEQIDQARAEVQRAEVEARRAQLDLQRTERLAESGAVSQQQLDNARLAKESADAALARARSSLAAAQSQRRSVATQVSAAEGRLAQSEPVDAQVEAAEASTELAEAHVDQAEAAVRLAELAVSYAQITSPVDGTVSNLDAEPGRIVSPGQPLATVVPDATYVVANFKETQIGEMRPGDRAEVEIDAYPGRSFEGVVESIAAGTGASFSVIPANNATGNFVKVVQRVPVRVAWRDPPDVPLRVGLSVTVTVHVDEQVEGSARVSR